MRGLWNTVWPMVEELPPKVHSVVITLHPAFSLRGRSAFKPGIKTNIARAARWSIAREGPKRVPEGVFNLTAMPDEVHEARAQCDMAREPWMFDIETPYENHERITEMGILTQGAAFVFPWDEGYSAVMRDAFAGKGVSGGHNVYAFDLPTLANYGVEPGPERKIVDTIVAGSLVWPPFKGSKKARWLALSACVLRVCDGLAFWKKPEWETTRALFQASWPGVPEWLQPRLYCGLDNVYTGKLWRAERALLKAEGML